VIFAWVIASAATTASAIGSACLVGTLLVKRGFSKASAGVMASGVAQAAAASIGSYFLIRNGFVNLYTVSVSPQLLAVWLVVTAAALLTVAISNKVGDPMSAPIAKDFMKLYEVCRPCFFALPLLVAPVCEEILFRGLLQAWLATVIGAWPALGVATMVFTVGHVRALGLSKSLVTVAVLAALLGVPVALYGTLIPSMITHALCNLAGVRDTLISSRPDQLVGLGVS